MSQKEKATKNDANILGGSTDTFEYLGLSALMYLPFA